MTKEFCIVAAIRMKDGTIVRGDRHCHAMWAALDKPMYTRQDVKVATQGFITSTNRFVDRKEGMRLQKASGRSAARCTDGKYYGELLYSEDLY